jgi:ribonuclease BN (tRNA processing enzyme)
MLMKRIYAASVLVVLLLGVPSFPAAQGPPKSGTRIVLLGTGTPNADPERSGPAVAIVVNGSPYLVDCGPGVVRRAAAAERKGIQELAVPKLDRLFVTHLHSDHTLGYPDLIFSPWTLGRRQPLDAYGPPGIREMTKHLLQAYREDREIRMNGGEPSNVTGGSVTVHEIRPGIIYKDRNVVVRAFPVHHGAWPLAYGYRLETSDRKIVVSGDTGPDSGLAEYYRDCDVLVHEVYSRAGLAQRPPEWQRYHTRYHTSSQELAEMATKVQPKLLILYHQLLWGTSEEDLLKELQQGYPGRVVSGRDLDVFDLSELPRTPPSGKTK